MSMSLMVLPLSTSLPSMASARRPTTASKTRIAMSGCRQVRYAVRIIESVPASTLVPALASTFTTLSATIPGKENLFTYFSSFLYRLMISWHRPRSFSSNPDGRAEIMESPVLEEDSESEVVVALPLVTEEKKLPSEEGVDDDDDVDSSVDDSVSVSNSNSASAIALTVAGRSNRKVIFCAGSRAVTDDINPSVVDTGHIRSPRAESTARIRSPIRTAFRASLEAFGVKPMIST
mmetsp:Transcript_7352/g.18447  ORF Transcript_7352/g.18447 Transcript_7352/m.18447 type:complete len:234 (+) Transcript_7352:1859-2560(+)